MRDSGTTWRLGHRPALDGLRGVAILIVLVCHVFALGSSDPDRLHPLSAVGVTLFFVLSGFLITSLIAEEHERAGAVSMRGFYIRRARRLLPALVLVVLLIGIPAVRAGAGTWRGLLAIAFYCANFVNPGAYFGQAWSLSIEEQFYFVWPLIMILVVRRRRAALVVAATGCTLSAAWTLVLPMVSAGQVYARTDVHAASLLAGCALALAAREGLTGVRSQAVTCAALAGLCMFWFVPGWQPRIDSLVLVGATAVSVLAVWGACWAPVWLLVNPLMCYLGTRSYGLYLWHFPVMALMLGATGHAHVPERLLSLVVSMALAETSWQLVEVRFTRHSTPRSGNAGDASEELVRCDALGARAPG